MYSKSTQYKYNNNTNNIIIVYRISFGVKSFLCAVKVGELFWKSWKCLLFNNDWGKRRENGYK